MKYRANRYRYLLLILFVISGTLGYAQPADLKFRHLDVYSGLPVNTITAVTKDSLGYIWIGTKEGLCRYDGYKFRIYKHLYNDSNSLPDNVVSALLLANNNQLWISTGKGICRFDYRSNKFYKPFLPDSLHAFRDCFLRLFIQDREGFLWFQDYNKKLLGYNPYTHKYRTLDFFFKDGERKVVNMYQESSGRIWISFFTYFYCWDPATNYIQKFHNPGFGTSPNNLVNAFSEAGDGSLWLATWGAGLIHFYPSTQKSDFFLVEKLENLSSAKNVICSPTWIHDSRSGKPVLWLVSEYGVLCFDTTAKKFTTYAPDIYNPYSNNITYGVSNFPGSYYDKQQNILWCYGPNGVDLCDFNAQQVQTFKSLNENKKMQIGSMDGLINNINNNNEYYIASFITPSIFIYNEAAKNIVEKKMPFTNGGIEALFQPDKKTIWISAHRDIWEWHPSDNTLKKLPGKFDKDKDKIAQHSTIINYFRDSRGLIWIGTNGAGFCRYDEKTGRSLWLNKGSPNRDSLMPGYIMGIAEAADKNIYVLDLFNGLFKISPSGEMLKRYFPDSFLSANTHLKCKPFKFSSIASHQTDKVWICSDEGLLAFNTHTAAFTTFNHTDGLPDGVPYSVEQDRNNYLWLDYNTTLSVFDPATKRSRYFNYRNGYEGSPDGGHLIINNKGEMRIGYNNHIESVNGDPFRSVASQMPSVLITQALSGDRQINIYDSSGTTGALHVNYKNNQIALEYALPLYHNPDDIVYSYKLEGYDRVWTKGDITHIAKYTNLPGGTYTFYVKAFDPNSSMYSSLTSLAVVVHPPFWKTWWFICSYIILIFLAVYLFYRYRLEQVLKLQSMRMAISSDLHDEVGATLSSISIYSNVARKIAETDKEQSKEYLAKIETSSREMIDSMSDIVWSINPANDDPEKMLQRMRSYAYEILGASNIELLWSEDRSMVSLKMSMEQRKNLYLFFKEAVNNAAKYSKATNVKVSLLFEHNEVVMTIQDNGIGFNNLTDYSGNGLKNMQFRTSVLKGNFRLKSAPHSGTELCLSFPL